MWTNAKPVHIDTMEFSLTTKHLWTDEEAPFPPCPPTYRPPPTHPPTHYPDPLTSSTKTMCIMNNQSSFHLWFNGSSLHPDVTSVVNWPLNTKHRHHGNLPVDSALMLLQVGNQDALRSPVVRRRPRLPHDPLHKVARHDLGLETAALMVHAVTQVPLALRKAAGHWGGEE